MDVPIRKMRRPASRSEAYLQLAPALPIAARVKKRLDPPIELMIADNPRVVSEMIEQIDHQLAFVAQTDIRPLIDIADVDQNRVRISPAPPANLRRTTR